MAKPVLKWAGGKRQLLDELYARFPASFDRYHEPFFGGGAVFFDLEPAESTVNDTNPRLVNFYEQVRDRPEALIGRLREFRDPEAGPDPEMPFDAETRRGKAVEQYYYQQRARFNERAYGDGWPADDDDRLEEAALLLYLNRTCYNGLYRENGDGGFNVPIGRYADPDWVQADRVREAAAALAGTELRNGDFSYVLDAAEPGDLVYFDPPYEPMSPTADFAEYSAAGFDRADQERLLEVAVELDERGVRVVLSNSGVTYDRYDEAGFFVEREGATRAINSDASSRGEVDEIVATNVPEGERRGPDQRALDDY
ncbi:DNA adenine methylase [Halosimplex pelagicum]|uniref:site-specific DNA-methyltransferase (adenine-specific) n=1 Tax=Halosimplex pelagicum TaxID=869886 RepID=A0A7D5T6C5_9EURY|nr:Dam family site-specific DNA-(adenine-N6)-methyltransferase [Halosimplex pelagicum]QLH83188.1 Dam family site-specific DNA-(adenine-N6)-methyltransferase [Halosimplex pelagicum]